MTLALLAIGSTAQVIAAAAVVPFTENFDSVSANGLGGIPMPTGWSSVSVTDASNSTAAEWQVKDALSNPTIDNYSEKNSVRFNSDSATSGNTARLQYCGVFDFAGYSTLEFTFEMSHDNSGSSSHNDSVQWQYKTGTDWTNIGTAKTRYQSGTAHWDKETVDFSSLIGKTNVTLGLLGTSRQGNNIFIDNISVTGTSPAAVPEASTLIGFGSSLLMAGPGLVGWLRRRRA